jgi:hypothetical protein
MQYIAGIFDAEGWVSLTPKGTAILGIELCNEEIPNLFKEKFGGSVYKRRRENKKTTWSWRSSNGDTVKKFLSEVTPFCVIKFNQLNCLIAYLSKNRNERRETRKDHIQLISYLKKPRIVEKGFFEIQVYHAANTAFFQWLAGILDGDGNFCVYESFRERKWTIFQSWVAIFSIYPETIRFIKERINGSVSALKQNKNPVWRLAILQENVFFICQSVCPFLKIKKGQCELLLEYQKMKKPDRFSQYTPDQKGKIRYIAQQIKHLNSL